MTERARSISEFRGWILASAGLGCFFTGIAITHLRKANATPTVVAEAQAATSPTPVASGPEVVTLSLVYSTEIGAWLRPAVEAFEREDRAVRVELRGMGSLDAERAIESGRITPTLWIPADSSAVDMLEAARSGAVVRDAGRWPRALALTPMVFVVWESRARALGIHGPTLPWTRLSTVARAAHGWAESGGDAAWGAFKFGHTDPTRSQAGLTTLALMAYGWRGRASTLSPGDVSTVGFEGFLRVMEASNPAGDRGTTSSGEFAQTLALQGPGRYDVAMVYESQAIENMELARGRWNEGLRVFYPPINLWSDHPLCLLGGANVSAAQRAAAERLSDHLRSESVQRDAVRRGLRPADVSIPVATEESDNPFVRYREQGVTVALSQVADPPSLATLDALTATWRRATGR